MFNSEVVVFVKKDMKAGDVITPECIRSVRPGYGLLKYFDELIGRRAKVNIRANATVTRQCANLKCKYVAVLQHVPHNKFAAKCKV